jgi:hypothetical protein
MSDWIPTRKYALLMLPFCIVFCEMTIKLNRIEGVHDLRSVSQLVPFVLGLGQVVDVSYRCLFDASNNLYFYESINADECANEEHDEDDPGT